MFHRRDVFLLLKPSISFRRLPKFSNGTGMLIKLSMLHFDQIIHYDLKIFWFLLKFVITIKWTNIAFKNWKIFWKTWHDSKQLTKILLFNFPVFMAIDKRDKKVVYQSNMRNIHWMPYLQGTHCILSPQNNAICNKKMLKAHFLIIKVKCDKFWKKSVKF